MILIRRSLERLGVQSGDCDGYGFGSSYCNSVGWRIDWSIGSSIGRLEAQLIGGSLRYRPVGRSLGRSIGRLCSLRDWSWWPRLRGTIGVS